MISVQLRRPHPAEPERGKTQRIPAIIILLVFALLLTQTDQREAGKTGLPLVALEHWLCRHQ